MNEILRKLYIEKKEFVTSDTLEDYCKTIKKDYKKIIRYFLARKYLVRIFKGIFYVRSMEEIKLNKSRYNYLELIAKGIELKKIKDWYFGFYTAVKLNNLTHEFFPLAYVINDKILRTKPVSIAEHKVKFIKLKKKLFGFGIIKKDKINYSDVEKTILDFVYIWLYNAIPEEKAILDVSEWIKNASRNKLKKYGKNYPKTVRKIIEKAIKIR